MALRQMRRCPRNTNGEKIMTKNNLPPARGFANSNPDEDLRKCLICGLILSDDMPRAMVIDKGEIGVYCISCSEADTDSIKFGTPKNPLSFNE